MNMISISTGSALHNEQTPSKLHRHRTLPGYDDPLRIATWDLAARLPQALATLRQAQGGPSDGVLNLYGLARIGEKRDGEWAYSLGDALNSVRQWADEDGDVTYAAGYRPFGVVLWEEGSSESSWGFTGEWNDNYIKLTYLRARWYEVETGRFLSLDTIIPDFHSPASIHRYLYAFANPLRYIDPSGHIACLDEKCNWVVHPGTREIAYRNPATHPLPESWWSLPEQRPDYYYFNVGLSLPDWIMLGGLCMSTVNPEIGVPLALAGGYLKLTPVEMVDIGGGLILDRYGNVYFNIQGEGTVLRVPSDISLAVGYGELLDGRSYYIPPNPSEVYDNLVGGSFTIFLPLGILGVTLSPGAKIPGAKEHGLANSFVIGVSAGWTFRVSKEWLFENFPPFAYPPGMLPPSPLYAE
jgi:RHS repeat-associated protein